MNPLIRQLIMAGKLPSGNAGYDTDAQSYIDAVNVQRATEGAATLTTTAEEILDDMINLLKGNSAPNGQLTGLTAVNCWSAIQHFVMFRGSGNVGTGTTVKAIVGSDGTLVNGHPWDARGDNSNDYIEFPFAASLDCSAASLLWGGLWATTGAANNGRVWAFGKDDVAGADLAADGFTLRTTTDGAAATAEAVDTFAIYNKTFADKDALSVVFDDTTGTLEEVGETPFTDAYTNATAIPDLLRYNSAVWTSAAPGNYSNSRPHYGLIVSSVLDATARANVHAILQAAYDALTPLEPIVVYDFSAGAGGFGAVNGTVAGNLNGVYGRDDCFSFTANTATGEHRAQRNLGSSLIQNGTTYRITGEYYIPSANSDSYRISMRLGNSIDLSVQDAWTAFDETVVASQAWHTAFLAGASTTFTDAGGDDVFYLRDLKIWEQAP